MSRKNQTTAAQRAEAAATKAERQWEADKAARITREACTAANRAGPQSRQVLRQWERKRS